MARVYPPLLAEARRGRAARSTSARRGRRRPTTGTRTRSRPSATARSPRPRRSSTRPSPRPRNAGRKGDREADAKYPPLLQAVTDRRDAALKEADEVYPRRLKEHPGAVPARVGAGRRELPQGQGGDRPLHAEAWDALEARWRDGLAAVDAIATSVRAEADRRFLDWHNADLDTWDPPDGRPPRDAVRQPHPRPGRHPQGHPRRPPAQGATGRPATTSPRSPPSPTMGSVLIKAADAGKAEAVSLLQALMLRYITSVPPGKVRFTIIDPVGLGENFAAFMHLADYNELLVTSRIWTEHAAHRAAPGRPLGAHGERDPEVPAQRVRDDRGVQRPRRRGRRAVPRPGRRQLPGQLQRDRRPPARQHRQQRRALRRLRPDLARHQAAAADRASSSRTWSRTASTSPGRTGKFQWKDAELRQVPADARRPARPRDDAPGCCTGSASCATNANKRRGPVRVHRADAREVLDAATAARGVDVPLGRAGATKLQRLKLGKGTSQHVLIAGKTGSGKSTLLHALITNAALRYSPDEVELYLIDFKKGVEFKVYAALELPHARVIAVESEREFGLSVLQRLDAEMKDRGDTLPRPRRAGPRTATARPTRAATPCPASCSSSTSSRSSSSRTTRSRRRSALLLDRLVRQGRAFGIHVILGSQTPRRGLLAGPEHDRPDGRPDRLAVQRGGRPPDPQRGELAPPGC